MVKSLVEDEIRRTASISDNRIFVRKVSIATTLLSEPYSPRQCIIYEPMPSGEDCKKEMKNPSWKKNLNNQPELYELRRLKQSLKFVFAY